MKTFIFFIILGLNFPPELVQAAAIPIETMISEVMDNEFTEEVGGDNEWKNYLVF